MNKNKIIINFVKNTLGCNCPDSVFQYIDNQEDVNLANDIKLNNKIKISNRLLIYILEINDLNDIYNKISNVTDLGRRERDLNNFNRFRLVLITNNIDDIEKEAFKMFNMLRGNDDKIHLHIINKNMKI